MLREININFSSVAKKQIKKLPKNIVEAIEIWATSLYEVGLNKTRMKSGYHDEPLKGKREGQRSIRLNRSYRLIYEETVDGLVIYIIVIEVNKHEY
ncbi:MAG: type II toxin-antitoxin system mRNA interferase toxin, RelE/StbE family [Rhizobacter sp.]|nr:type II toxin-antitoxin system mRNA interferase toxin, RelE/StbE family [Bacteriovorax sp.]